VGEEPNHTTAEKAWTSIDHSKLSVCYFSAIDNNGQYTMFFYSVNACSEQMQALKDHKRLGVSGIILPDGSDGTTGRWWQEMMLSFMKKAYGQKLQY
jgi:hypothetical protein